MKKIILLSVFLCAIFSTYASRLTIPIQQHYVVVSDEFDKRIPEGKCLVMGHVYWQDFNNPVKDFPAPGGHISTLDREKTTISDSTGLYKLILDSDDTSIFLYLPYYEEVVIWNYNFQSQHVVTINFYPTYDLEMITVPAKPVIYLYSQEEIKSTIQFFSTSALTFTYPLYNGKWDVTVNENGITENNSKKKYPYLFWEAEPADLNFLVANKTITGFLIRTDSIVNFLENSLSKLGLNEKEQTDYITYWVPKIITKPFVLIQFLIDESYSDYVASINVSPTPDAMRRIFMLFKPLDTNQIGLIIKPQELKSFERSGFTVVEWGGSEMSMSNLIP